MPLEQKDDRRRYRAEESGKGVVYHDPGGRTFERSFDLADRPGFASVEDTEDDEGDEQRGYTLWHRRRHEPYGKPGHKLSVELVDVGFVEVATDFFSGVTASRTPAYEHQGFGGADGEHPDREAADRDQERNVPREIEEHELNGESDERTGESAAFPGFAEQLPR